MSAASARGQGAGTEPVRQSLAREAYDDLLARLRSGLVGPDDRLVDLDIAQALGVSRMPVREALLRLVSEGYLVSTARGYRLPALSLADVTEIFEVRRLIEPRAAALAARDARRATLTRLTSAMNAARAAAHAGDFSRLFRANVEFREAWLSAVRNGRLRSTIARFVYQVQAVSHGTLRDRAVQELAVGRLAELHDAFVHHDSVTAHDSMLRFLDAAEKSFVALHEAGLQAAMPVPATPVRPPRRTSRNHARSRASILT